MAAPQQVDWRSDHVRQKIRQQIDEQMTRFGNPFNKTAEEIENSIFESGRTKEGYLTFIQNILKRIRGQQQAPQQRPMQSTMMRPPMQPGQMQQQMGQVQQQQGAPVQTGMPMRQFNQMPRGPPSDSPSNMNMQSPLNSGGITGFSPDNRMPHPSPSSQYYPRPQMIARGQPQAPQAPSIQPQLKMPETYANTPQGTYIPSLSPAHPNNSPQVSSMSPALRTPGSVSVAHSPAGAAVPSPSTGANANNPPQQQPEEARYMEKLKQLQKYIEPLSRMINKVGGQSTSVEEKNSKDLSKMKNLRDILIDPTKRLPIFTLLKCEKVLKNWLDDKPVPTPPPPRPDQHMCQPILDAVATAIKSPLLNHTLKRTFGPALEALNGDYRVPDEVCTKRVKIQSLEGDEADGNSDPARIKVPNIIQGEIARLGSKFKVTVDQSQSSSYGKLHLICRIDDQNLPYVPLLRIIVPTTYPKDGPKWVKPGPDEGVKLEELDPAPNNEGESDNPIFLTHLLPNMEKHINHALDHNESISSILTAWERGIKETMASQITVNG